MDDEHDGTYEILDLGPARDKRRKEAEADLPTPNSEAEPAPGGDALHAAVIDLGEGADAPMPSPPVGTCPY